jgi:hypothetical protein
MQIAFTGYADNEDWGTCKPSSSSFFLILFALFCHRKVRKKKTDCEGFVSAMRTASLKKTPKGIVDDFVDV